MSWKQIVSKSLHCCRVGVVAVTAFQFSLGGPLATTARADADDHRQDHGQDHGDTATPIKHVIVLIGENRTFDHLFATYVSPSGDFVKNLRRHHQSGRHSWKKLRQSRAVPGSRPFQDQLLHQPKRQGKSPLHHAAGTDLELLAQPRHRRAASISAGDPARAARRSRALA